MNHQRYLVGKVSEVSYKKKLDTFNKKKVISVKWVTYKKMEEVLCREVPEVTYCIVQVPKVSRSSVKHHTGKCPKCHDGNFQKCQRRK